MDMNTSDIISSIAAILSAIALWVSYRAYQQSNDVRFNDKLMELRVRVIELRNRALLTQSRATLLSKSYPEHVDTEMRSYFERLSRKSEDLHNLMFKKPKDWDQKFLEDKIIEIRALEGEINQLQEKVEKIFQKI